VRILRVVRFAAKLGFKLEAKTEKPLREMLGLLANVPASRMFDEMIKLLQTGHALASLEQIRRFGLDKGVFPVLDAVLRQAAPAACARSSSRWRWPTPTAGWARASRWRPASCWPACSGMTCKRAGSA
jgi:tRNA nucleotidyltransferase/poly(A) polymerase